MGNRAEYAWPVAGGSSATFGAVLQKYRQRSGMSQPQLAQYMGVTRNTVTNWETDKSRPEVEAIRTLSALLEIPLNEWFGLSEENEPAPRERELLRQYRRLGPVNRRVVEQVVGTLLEEEARAREADLREHFFLLPLESTPAAAGPGCPFGEAAPEYRFLRRSRFNEGADALVRVCGDSMEPHYRNGDLVYLKYTQEARDGDDVVCSTADGAVIKRVRDHKLYSLNRALPFGEKNEDDHVVVLGRVLGIVSAEELPDPADLPALEELNAAALQDFERRYGQA